MNGSARRFSRRYSPGAMKSQSCHITAGAAMTTPASAATFSCSMKASVGSV